MIHLVVTMNIKPQALDAFLAVAARLRPQVLAEPGCVTYTYIKEIATGNPGQEPMDPNRITLVECWESQAALDAHLATAHMKAFSQEVRDLRVGAALRIGVEAV